ncbi:hypothetical protein [Helicobacter cetorum]|uniref:hypothetical protein n=1 Tax=Helicobacter cetorum TaxID=138563 RepID=UPI000CF0B6D8|nr:hypothetical protein [Helicobacter cetorum]
MKKYALLCSFITAFLFSSCLSPKIKNTSLVSIFIAHQGQSVRTYWRKIDREVVAKHNTLLKEKGLFNSDVYKSASKLKLKDPRGRLFALGGNNFFMLLWKNSYSKSKVQTIKLEPGYYYLDSFSIHTEKNIIQSASSYPSLRNGYDFKNNQPFFLAFEVRPNQKNITLPSVELSLKPFKNGVVGVFLFNNNEKGANAKWIEGSLNQKLKKIILKDTIGH